MPEQAWRDALNQFEARLDEHEAVLDAVEDGAPLPADPTAYDPSPDLGPLPDSLRQRASDLAVRADRLSRALETHRSAVASELASLAQRGPSGRVGRGGRRPSPTAAPTILDTFG